MHRHCPCLFRRFLLSLSLLALGGAVAAPAQTVYMTTSELPAKVYRLDLATATGELVAELGVDRTHATAFCPDADLHRFLLLVDDTSGDLLEVDLEAGGETTLGPLPGGFAGNVHTLTCAASGLLYLINAADDSLYRLDPATCGTACAPLLLGVVETSPGAGDVDVNGGGLQLVKSGELYLLNDDDGKLYRIDAATAAATLVGSPGTGTCPGMAEVPGTRLVAGCSNGNFYEIDRTDGSASLIGPMEIGTGPLAIDTGDLASPAVPVAGTAHMATGPGPTQLMAVDLAVNETTTLFTFTEADVVHALAFCPDPILGERGYAIGKENGVVMEVDLAGNTDLELGVLPPQFIPNHVVQLTCDRDRLIYFTSQKTDELFTLDPATCATGCAPALVGRVETAPGLADVDVEGADLQVDADGNLFLLTNGALGDPAGKQLYRIDKATAAATPIGGVATGTTNFGMTLNEEGRMIIASNDDNFYEVDMTDASLASTGRLMAAGDPLDLALNWGDLAAPTPFNCEFVLTTDRTAVRPGERLTYHIFLRHMLEKEVRGSFSVFVTDAAGQPVSPVRKSNPGRIDHLQVIETTNSFVVPGVWQPGGYTLWAWIKSMAQGIAVASVPFEVLPAN